MSKNEINKYTAELTKLVQSFINDYEHPEDGFLIINLDNIEDKKVVYIEETLQPSDDIEWAEYSILDLLKDPDAPEEKWELDPAAFTAIAEELLNI